jgi:hypothetical protein
VQTDANGLAWLQNVTVNKTIKFVPLSNDGNECIARVFVLRQVGENRIRSLDAARSLVKMGFAKATVFPEELTRQDKTLVGYQNRLKDSEKIAKLLRRGQWHLIPENWLQRKLRRSLEVLKFNLTPTSRKVPEFVR